MTPSFHDNQYIAALFGCDYYEVKFLDNFFSEAYTKTVFLM